MKRSYSLITYGCQMNKHDSECIAGILEGEGYRPTERLASADLILVNTCSIREKAEQKVYSELGRLKALKIMNPGLVLGVCGCIAQRHGERLLEKAPGVDLVFGTQNISRLPVLLRRLEAGESALADIEPEKEEESLSRGARREGRIRAWVSIARGCDNYCSYCVVPYARGPERSRPSQEVLREVRELAREGFKEVTLLGQNVNSYGKGLEREVTFPELLRAVDKVEGIERVRFITSHPKDLSSELVEAVAELAKVCEHLHLPVQSGSDRTLRAMRRGYTVEEYLQKVESLRTLIPEVGLTADIIVGFPGEGEEDHRATRELLSRVRYDNIFLFKYSPRPGTAAARLPHRVSPEVAARRFSELLELQKAITLEKNRSLEGRIEEVLVEGESKTRPDRLTGRARSNRIVNFSGPVGLVGELLSCRITRGGLYSLEGEPLN